MPDYGQDLAMIKEAMAKGDDNGILRVLDADPGALFATPEGMALYTDLKSLDTRGAATRMPMLAMAWLAFLNGDNAGLHTIYPSIAGESLATPDERAMYLSLKAFVEGSRDPAKALLHSGKALEAHKGGAETLARGNALLTHAQILAGTDKYRQAAAEFKEAHRIFVTQGLDFPAAIALTNACLNLYRLGEFLDTADMCRASLTKAASFAAGLPPYWEVVNLPLGMCYFELGRFGLALRHLARAKAFIDASGLFHMHGLVELFMFKAHKALGDDDSAAGVVGDCIRRFEHMNDRQFDLMLSMLRVYARHGEGTRAIRPDEESLSLEFMERGTGTGIMVLQALAYLRARGLSQAVSISDMEKSLERLRFTGNIPDMHPCLLRLAELCMAEGAERDATGFMKEAVRISRENGIVAGYHDLTPAALGILKAVEPKLYREVTGEEPEADGGATNRKGLLTLREREILALMAKGASNEEIGKTLYIGVGTIKWHINHIFGKLEAKNRIQAVEAAKALGELD